MDRTRVYRRRSSNLHSPRIPCRAGSIRTEELVNYFSYDYRDPGRDDTFAVNASIIDCPWNKETKLVNLGIKAKEMEDIDDVASNIVFLIDVSGSMDSYDKLPLYG